MFVCLQQTFGFWRKTNLKFGFGIHTLKWSESDSIFHQHKVRHKHTRTHALTHTYIYLDLDWLVN